MKQTAYLVASGDLRLSANQTCWAAQELMEKQVIAAFEREGMKVIRAHPYNPQEKHGFISSQRMGMDVFETIPREAPVIAAIAVWQYSYHLLGQALDVATFAAREAVFRRRGGKPVTRMCNGWRWPSSASTRRP